MLTCDGYEALLYCNATATAGGASTTGTYVAQVAELSVAKFISQLTVGFIGFKF